MKLQNLFEENKKLKLPTWANDKDGKMIDKAIRSGKLDQYKIVVSDEAPMISGRNWGGSWTITPQNERTIYLERSMVEQARKIKALWALSHTVKHEKMEIEIAIKLARSKYPEKSPYVMCNNTGGEAHTLTCKELDGMTEDEYDRNLTLELKFFKES